MIRVCVIGGGPAGLSAAIHAARAGASSVVLLERNGQCGVKLLATGGGHCNVSNLHALSEWQDLFGRRGRFILPAMNFLPLDALKRFFEEIGQPLIAADGFHLYPISNSAKAVRDALVAEAIRLGVSIRHNERVTDLAFEDNGTIIVGGDGEKHVCDKLIIAVGGRSYPATGSTGDVAIIAKAAGYKIKPFVPGLVGLRVSNLSPDFAGLVFPNSVVAVKLRGKGTLSGCKELLLTHGGISGPAVLDSSASIAEQLGESDMHAASGKVVLHIRWCAELTPVRWIEKFATWRRDKGGTGVKTLLKTHIPQKLAGWLCEKAGMENGTTASSLPASVRDSLAELLGAFPASVAGSEGWDKAMITRGGVDITQVDPVTLAGKLTRGLHFAGEALDVDGPCGGYNLHWAFASGALAGTQATILR